MNQSLKIIISILVVPAVIWGIYLLLGGSGDKASTRGSTTQGGGIQQHLQRGLEHFGF